MTPKQTIDRYLQILGAEDDIGAYLPMIQGPLMLADPAMVVQLLDRLTLHWLKLRKETT